MGRPTKFTDEAQDLFITAVNAGVPIEVAAQYAGFGRASMFRYLRGSSPKHLEFRRRYLRALSALQIRLAGTVLQAANTDPRWAMEVLQRRWPEHWGRGRIDDLGGDPSERTTPNRIEPLVRLDPALVDELVPRLIEAGQRLSGRTVGTELPDSSTFADDGVDDEAGDREAGG